MMPQDTPSSEAAQNAPSPTPRNDSNMVGKYRLIAKLGQGGMAEVFLAVVSGPASFNKLVVIKRHTREAVAMLSMFLDEAKLAARLNHPNIVQTYEIGGDEGGGYHIVMEYLEGQALNRVLKAIQRNEPGAEAFTRDVTIQIVIETLNGLQYAHDLTDYDGSPLGIVHRDISPHNLFVTYDGSIKIVDFGIAKATINTTRTEAGQLKGKVAYMAPEQVTGGMIDRRADVFAVGLVLWEIIAQRRLMEGNAAIVLRRLLDGNLPRVSTVVPDVPPELDDIVAKALEHDPDKRYQSAFEFRRALEDFLKHSGRAMPTDAIRAGMQTIFAERRTLIREQVKAQIERISNSSADTETLAPVGRETMSSIPSSLPSLDGSDSSPRNGPNDTGSGIRNGAGSSSSLAVQVSSASTTAPKRNHAWSAVGLGALLLLAIGALVLRPAPAPPPAPAQAAISTAMPAPTPNAPSAGTVEITTEPAEAIVTWQDKAMGTTPIKLDLPPGTQSLLVSKRGFIGETLVILVAAGVSTARVVKLRADEEALTAANAAAAPLTTQGKRLDNAPPRGTLAPTNVVPVAEAPPTSVAPANTAPPVVSAGKPKIQVVNDGNKPLVKATVIN